MKVFRHKLLLCFVALSTSFTLFSPLNRAFSMETATMEDAAPADETAANTEPDLTSNKPQAPTVDESTSPFNGNINERVKGFDIGGIRLGMKLEDVQKAMKKEKYVQRDLVNSVPEFFRYNYDLECRNQNITQYDNLKMCISSLARRDNVEFLQKLVYKKPGNNEEIQVFFTSNFNGHIVLKVIYLNDLNTILGEGKNFKYQREENRRAFWYQVQKKYGDANIPPNTWRYDLEDDKSVTLIASYQGLMLDSKGMEMQDQKEVLTKAREMFKAKDFSF